MAASSVAPAIGRNDLIFKRANSQEELVLADSSSSGENRCCGDEAGDKHCLITEALGIDNEIKPQQSRTDATGIASCRRQLRPSPLTLRIKADVQEPTGAVWSEASEAVDTTPAHDPRLPLVESDELLALRVYRVRNFGAKGAKLSPSAPTTGLFLGCDLPVVSSHLKHRSQSTSSRQQGVLRRLMS